MRKYVVLFVMVAGSVIPFQTISQKFIHPGIDQTSGDLAYMKAQVLKGEQPWKDAFDKMKAATDLNFDVKAFAHVKRGGYGRPNIGGDDLSKSANTAYNCALMWYITNDKAYADKAIQIINTWSPVLWDFDYNDAKLLAAWTGHLLCNAAEILRYTGSGWQQKNIDSFTNLMMTVYYPLMRYYFPQANGNWDGAIIHSLMAIGIFTDNRAIFNNAVDHFLRAPVNGSIFKYIYPSGQCQETPRDQAHVQLGLGEFAGAARIAYTQGVDLFSIGNNRIALGYEYTASFLMGETPQSYGTISQRAKRIRDDYEYVYRHYAANGIDLPYTKMAADSAKSKATRSILTAFRAPSPKPADRKPAPKPFAIAYPAGAMPTATIKAPENAVVVIPGQSIQDALNAAATTSGWVVAAAGLHTLPTTLQMPSGVTLSGEGLKTILFLTPEVAAPIRDAITNAAGDMHDVTLRDLVVEGSSRPEPPNDPNSARSFRSGANRGGIIFEGVNEGSIKNINLSNVTVRNCTYNGVSISGATGVNIINCNFEENGATVVPGPKLQHNLLLNHCSKINVKDSRLDTSPNGSGIALLNSHDAVIDKCEIARNNYYGVLLAECANISITGNLVEGNDRSGIMLEFLYKGSDTVTISNNIIHYNDGHGVEGYAARNVKTAGNTYAGNKNTEQKLSAEKLVLMN
jgi:parallel beta-helix repeat protein